MDTCNTLFLDEPSVKDTTGCLKPYAHHDFHVFKDKHGDLIAWDYDWGCKCGCWDSDEFRDACRVYWKVDKI